MMKQPIFNILAIIAICMPLIPASCQNDKKPGKIKAPAELIKYAEKAAGLKYPDKLNQALSGNVGALIELIDFHRYADGAEGNMHSDVLLELLYAIGDEAFAQGCMGTKPKLKPTVIERMIFAQGRATRPELKAPIAEWAPKTFSILTGAPMPSDSNAPGAEVAPAQDVEQGAGSAPTDATMPQQDAPAPLPSPSLTSPTPNPGALAAPQPEAAEPNPAPKKKKKNKE